MRKIVKLLSAEADGRCR